MLKRVTIKNVISALTIIVLISGIILVSVLNFNMVMKISKQKGGQTIVYTSEAKVQEPKVLSIEF